MSGLVIIGGSYAGVQAAITAREEGYSEDVCIVSDEDMLPYQRPPLSKGYLLGTVEERGLVIRGEKFFADKRIDFVRGERAIRIDKVNRAVVLADERTLRCDRIVIATGSRSRDLPGAADVPGLHYLRSLDDARKLKQHIQECSELVLIGGGFIGLEVAASARKLGKGVVVIESADRLIARALSPTLSEYLLRAHRERGVDIRLGKAVERISLDGRRYEVSCNSGERVGGDLVLICVGGIANSEIASDFGIACDNGILVDEAGRTSLPDVLSAGDCTVFHNSAAGRNIRLESVQHAQDQARSVGCAIAGKYQPYVSVPRFWSDQYDLKIQMVGLPDGHDTRVIRGSLEEQRLSIFLFRNGKLAAVESVNKPGEQLIARRLIEHAISPSGQQAGDPSFDLKTLMPI